MKKMLGFFLGAILGFAAITTAQVVVSPGTDVSVITGLGTGVSAFLGTPSSANLKTAVTDETGSGGALVFATGPTISAPVIATISNTGTLTLPSATGGVPVLLDCGATGVGNQTCSPVTATALTKFYSGSSTLASNTAVITFPVAFAATTSYQCIANDITTRANPVQMLSTSASTATITNTTGASDVINWHCAGY